VKQRLLLLDGQLSQFHTQQIIFLIFYFFFILLVASLFALFSQAGFSQKE